MPNIGKLYIKQANTFSFYYLSLRKVYNSRGWPYMSNIKTIQGYCIEFTCLKGRKVDPQILLTIISLVSNMKKINSNFAKLFVFILRKREHVSNLYVYLFRSINYECIGVAVQCPPPTPTQDRFEVFAPQFWHERAAFQSVGIWAVAKDFSHRRSARIKKVDWSTQKPRDRHRSRHCWPFWGTQAAILDFAGSVAVRRCRR